MRLMSSARSCGRLSAVLSWSRRAQATLFMLIVLVMYAVTANYGVIQNHDVISMVVPVWQLVTSGTLYVDPHQNLSPMFFETDVGVISNRWPGTMLVALPAYLLMAPFLDVAEGPVYWPATIAAVIVSALAATALFTLVWARHDPVTAWLAGTVGALGTGLWTVAADSLWTHGPAVLLSLLALHALQMDKVWSAGCCFGALALVRPHLVVVAALVGYILARKRKDVSILVKIGLPAAVGVLLYVGYMSLLSGTLSTGLERYAFTPPQGWQRVVFVLGGLSAPRVGLLIYTPVLICCFIALRRVWPTAPDWQVAAFIGGLTYLIIQLQSNSYLGGYGLYGYRLPLETLAFAAPLLVHGGVLFVRRSQRHAAVFGALAAFSVWVSAVGAFLYVGRLGRVGAWSDYDPALTLASRPLPIAVAAVAFGLIAVVGAAWMAASHHARVGSAIQSRISAPRVVQRPR